MAGAGARRYRHDACVFCRVGNAPHITRIRRSRRHAHPRPFRESCGLHGRWLCPHHRQARGVHGAVGGCGQSCLGPAGRLARPQSGHRPDRPQGAVVPASQQLSGNPACAIVRRGDQILGAGQLHRRIAAAVAPCLARGTGRHAAADPSRFQRLARRCDRTRPDRRAAGHRPRRAPHPRAPPRRRCAGYRARRRGAACLPTAS